MADDPVPAAVPVGDYQVVVVQMNGETERFGLFSDRIEATDWAMLYRDSLGLNRCASWHIEEIGK